MHNCPRCGQPTNGAWSEGGLLWAICDDCMSADSSAVEEVRPTMRAVDDCPRCGGRVLHVRALATNARRWADSLPARRNDEF